MTDLQNILIDYKLFEKYDIKYFKENLIIPIWENEINFEVAVCKESNLTTIKNDFFKMIKFKEYDKKEIEFALSNLEYKILLYKDAIKTQHNIEQFIYKMIKFSINLRTSDIHIEEFEDNILFRFRIDGKLKTFFVFSNTLFKPLSSYIKLISNLDITQNRLPMDARFSLKISDKTYDFRVSTMPTITSESIVLRILDKKNINKSLQTLGLSSDLLDLLKKSLKLTQGLILLSGPTGSGKTTTLYSILKELKSNDRKIITVEDPVEYKIDSICQISINSKVGLSFELVLRNILRQDPDIIFIGEIRDKFSLDIALQASLTGHLVIATVHASSAIQTISRLIDLQADPFLISSTLKLVMAQRLVLNYCTNCGAKGCEKCNFTKFYDRSSIAEILKIDDELSSIIFKKVDINEIKKYLQTINFKTLLDDGKEKVSQNITSLEEVYKVVNI